MRQEDVWDEEAARRYDTPGTGMFAPEVLDPAVDRLAQLAGGGAALELAIGTGRIAIPLVARGVPVTGVELSTPMVEQLRTKADEPTIPVVIGDMASTRAPGSSSLAYLVCNIISDLLSPEEQMACFRDAARHLLPGGGFVIELWVPELRTSPPGQSASVFKTGPGCIGVDTIDVLHQQVVAHHFEFAVTREPACSAARTGTSGRASWTSWLRWPASSRSPVTATGAADRPRRTSCPTCRCTGSARPRESGCAGMDAG